VTKGGLSLSFAGMSELTFTADGKVARHIDHWDASKAFYEKLPLVGALLRAIRRRVSP